MYRVELKNNSLEDKKFALVFPVVASTGFQTVHGSPVFNANNCVVKKDRLYSNDYGYCDFDLKAEEKSTFEYSFRIDVSPVVGKNYYADDQDLMKKFCVKNSFLNSDFKPIIDKAYQLKGGSTDVMEIAKSFNDFVIDYLNYESPILGLYTGKFAFENRGVDCGGFDALFVTLCNSVGIPARIVSGFWAGYKESGMHAWAEFMLPDGRWVPVDPSIEQLRARGKTAKSGAFGFVGSDRVVFSVGCEIPVNIHDKEIFTDILQNPFLVGLENANDVAINLEVTSKKI